MPKATAANLDRLRPAEKAIYQRLRPLIGRSDVDQIVAHLRKAHPVWSDVYNITAERVREVLVHAGLEEQVRGPAKADPSDPSDSRATPERTGVAPLTAGLPETTPTETAPAPHTSAEVATAETASAERTGQAVGADATAAGAPAAGAPATGRRSAGRRSAKARTASPPDAAIQPALVAPEIAEAADASDAPAADPAPAGADSSTRSSAPPRARVVPWEPVPVNGVARGGVGRGGVARGDVARDAREVSKDPPKNLLAATTPRRARPSRDVTIASPVQALEPFADRSIELDQTPAQPRSSDDRVPGPGEPEAGAVPAASGEAGKSRSGTSASGSRAGSKKRPAGSLDELLQQIEAIESEVTQAHAEIEQVNRRIAELERRRQAVADQLALTLRSRVPAEILRLAAAETGKPAGQAAEQAG